MPRVFVYADESGNFDFSAKASASKFFIITTVVCQDHILGNELLDLRRGLAWSGTDFHRGFHATEDLQPVRDKVFDLISQHDVRIDATVLHKSKAAPSTRTSEDLFYKYAWYYHFRHVAPQIVSSPDELFVIASQLNTRSKRAAFHAAVASVVEQVSPTKSFRTAFWPCDIDPCLQVADYCSWAIQRKWERGDVRSHMLIERQITSEFDLFRRGTTEYY
ncbi:MAG: hypothetical protein GEU28_04180 [Dehalococcoidia bacterium]|nr:hypothetical protein [Dehalococcoidia bacterium]